MDALSRVAVIAAYEWRRALAKKKILALIILAVAFQTLVMLGLSALSRAGGTVLFMSESVSFMWIFGVLEGQSLFVPLIAIVIGGGSMSEEYEHGTADILLSKPVTRLEYMFGKFLGGFSLLAVIEALTSVVGVVLSLWFFGAQNGLQIAPFMFLAIVYSSLIFFCLSFMFSEVFRGSTLAMLAALGVLIALTVISPFLSMLYSATGQQAYDYLSKGIPTWAATNFPTFLLSKLITTSSTVLSAGDLEDLYLAALIIAVYAIVFILITAYRLLKSDVTKKTG
jgi:ABC-2 type transport system permease protein